MTDSSVVRDIAAPREITRVYGEARPPSMRSLPGSREGGDQRRPVHHGRWNHPTHRPRLHQVRQRGGASRLFLDYFLNHCGPHGEDEVLMASLERRLAVCDS